MSADVAAQLGLAVGDQTVASLDGEPTVLPIAVTFHVPWPNSRLDDAVITLVSPTRQFDQCVVAAAGWASDTRSLAAVAASATTDNPDFLGRANPSVGVAPDFGSLLRGAGAGLLAAAVGLASAIATLAQRSRRHLFTSVASHMGLRTTDSLAIALTEQVLLAPARFAIAAVTTWAFTETNERLDVRNVLHDWTITASLLAVVGAFIATVIVAPLGSKRATLKRFRTR
ncbi:MAG TPA: hypothetical protein PLV68_02700 [Ilumatobacteraceae bacterium]|nr:hypothetical protein [Ilumatobacteraceae bacterium]